MWQVSFSLCAVDEYWSRDRFIILAFVRLGLERQPLDDNAHRQNQVFLHEFAGTRFLSSQGWLQAAFGAGTPPRLMERSPNARQPEVTCLDFLIHVEHLIRAFRPPSVLDALR
jgi:hypothetical protein